MEYTEIIFRGRYITKQRKETFDNGMIFSAFNAWQVLAAKGLKTPWEKYLVDLGLKKKNKLTKQQLEIEARIAMQNVDRIMKKAGGDG